MVGKLPNRRIIRRKIRSCDSGIITKLHMCFFFWVDCECFCVTILIITCACAYFCVFGYLSRLQHLLYGKTGHNNRLLHCCYVEMQRRGHMTWQPTHPVSVGYWDMIASLLLCYSSEGVITLKSRAISFDVFGLSATTLHILAFDIMKLALHNNAPIGDNNEEQCLRNDNMLLWSRFLK